MQALHLEERLTRMSLGRGMHVGYSLGMPTGRIDREAWADEVATLIRRFDPGPRDPGNKSAFARRIGLTTRTVDRWIAHQVDVSLDSVRAVADALDIGQDEQVQLLSRIGYFTTPDRALTPPTYPDPRDDAVIRRIMADQRLTEEQRAELVQVQIDLIEQDVKRRQAEYERLIKHQQRPAS